MIAWVLETLLRAPEIDQVLVSIEDPKLLAGIEGIQDAMERGELIPVPSKGESLPERGQRPHPRRHLPLPGDHHHRGQSAAHHRK